MVLLQDSHSVTLCSFDLISHICMCVAVCMFTTAVPIFLYLRLFIGQISVRVPCLLVVLKQNEVEMFPIDYCPTLMLLPELFVFSRVGCNAVPLVI